jgi:hypothetical protein
MLERGWIGFFFNTMNAHPMHVQKNTSLGLLSVSHGFSSFPGRIFPRIKAI